MRSDTKGYCDDHVYLPDAMLNGGDFHSVLYREGKCPYCHIADLTAQLAESAQWLNNANAQIKAQLAELADKTAECERLKATKTPCMSAKEHSQVWDAGHDYGYRAGMERCAEIAELFSGNNGTGDRVANAIRAEMGGFL